MHYCNERSYRPFVGENLSIYYFGRSISLITAELMATILIMMAAMTMIAIVAITDPISPILRPKVRREKWRERKSFLQRKVLFHISHLGNGTTPRAHGALNIFTKRNRIPLRGNYGLGRIGQASSWKRISQNAVTTTRSS